MFKLSFRTDYADTDQMGIIHHASYLRYMERVRVEWMRSKGLPYGKMEEQGYYLPLANVAIKYERSLRFDEMVEVHLKVLEVSRVQIRLGYEFFRNGEPIISAMTHHALCKRSVDEKGQVRWVPSRIPKEWGFLVDV